MSLFDCNIGYSATVRAAYSAAIQRHVTPTVTIEADRSERRAVVTTWSYNQFLIRNVMWQKRVPRYASKDELAFLVEEPLGFTWEDDTLFGKDTYIHIDDSDCGQCAACGSLTIGSIERTKHNMSMLDQSDEGYDYDEVRIYPAKLLFQAAEARLIELWLKEPGPLGDLTRQLYSRDDEDSDG